MKDIASMRIAVLAVSLFSAVSTNAVLNGPSTDGDGNYTLSWTTVCGNDSWYYLYEDGSLTKSSYCSQTPSHDVTEKSNGTYNYVLHHCNTYWPEPGLLCTSDLGTNDGSKSVTVTGAGNPPPPPIDYSKFTPCYVAMYTPPPASGSFAYEAWWESNTTCQAYSAAVFQFPGYDINGVQNNGLPVLAHLELLDDTANALAGIYSAQALGAYPGILTSTSAIGNALITDFDGIGGFRFCSTLDSNCTAPINGLDPLEQESLVATVGGPVIVGGVIVIGTASYIYLCDHEVMEGNAICEFLENAAAIVVTVVSDIILQEEIDTRRQVGTDAANQSNPGQCVVIGQTMTRVIQAATNWGCKFFDAGPRESNTRENALLSLSLSAWLHQEMILDQTIYDIGVNAFAQSSSDFYEVEYAVTKHYYKRVERYWVPILTP